MPRTHLLPPTTFPVLHPDDTALSVFFPGFFLSSPDSTQSASALVTNYSAATHPSSPASGTTVLMIYHQRQASSCCLTSSPWAFLPILEMQGQPTDALPSTSLQLCPPGTPDSRSRHFCSQNTYSVPGYRWLRTQSSPPVYFVWLERCFNI